MARTIMGIFGIKELKCLKDYKGEEKTRLSKRYSALVESYPAYNKKIWLAKDNGEVLLSVYARQLNPVVSKNVPGRFSPELAGSAVRALDLLETFINHAPESIEAYMGVIESVGQICHAKKYRENIMPILDKALEIVKGLRLDDDAFLGTRLYLLSSSIGSTASVISRLNEYEINGVGNSKVVRIYEKVGDEIVRTHPDREELIRIYLQRGITAMGRRRNYDSANEILRIFSEIDSDIADLINEDEMDPKFKGGHLDRLVRLNEDIAGFLAKGRIAVEEFRKRLEMGGIPAIEKMIGK